MSEEKKSNDRIAEMEKEKEIKEAEDRLERIQKILGSVQRGWSIALYRRAPGWAEGHLETKRIIGDEELDLDYIAQQWGGEIIQIKILDEHGKYIHSAEIPFRSFPPKSWGKELIHPNYRHIETEKKTDVAPPTRDPLSSIDTIVGIIERLKGKEERPQQRDYGIDMGIIELLLRNQFQQQSSSSPLGAVEQFISIAEAMQNLSGVFGEKKPAMETDDLLGKVMGIIDRYSALKSTESSKPKVPRIGPPLQQTNLPAPNPQLPKQPLPNFPIPGNGNGSLKAGDLADLLSTLAAQNPKLAAESVILALDKMPENAKEEVLNNFYEIMDEDDEFVDIVDENEKKLQNLNHNATRQNGPENNSGE